MESYDTAMMHFSQERIGRASFETRNGVEANRRETDVMMDDGLDKKRGATRHGTMYDNCR